MRIQPTTSAQAELERLAAERRAAIKLQASQSLQRVRDRAKTRGLIILEAIATDTKSRGGIQ
jgi:hypothetical protein